VTGLTNGTAYTFTVTATNTAGTGTASAASNAVTPAASQTITFSQPATQNFGTTPTLSATATSGLTVSFTSTTTAVCTITSGGALTFVTAGTCTIDADQAGNSSYLAAPQVSRSFTVAAVVPGAPAIGVATAGNAQATIAFTAPASNGGSTITSYTVTSSPGGLTGTGASSPVTVTGLTNGTAYTFTVTATNTAGTGTASAASNSVTPAASQTITFSQPATQNFGTTPTLTATASSGLIVTFTSATTGVCTITSGGALTFVIAGTCTIDADQAGNSSYLAAPQVSRSFTVAAVVPGAPAIGTATAGNALATVTFTAPASNGGATVTGYTVTSSPAGGVATGTASPITVAGLSSATTYTFTVTATNSAGAGPASAASNSVRPLGSQPPPPPASISAISGSGQSGAAGAPFAAPLVVIVEDALGAPLPNVLVTFRVVSGLANLSTTTALTGTDGTAQTTVTPAGPGAVTISAGVGSLSQLATFTETALSSAPSMTAQLSVLPATLTFTPVEGGGNPAPVNIAVANTGAGTLPWTATASGSPSWLSISPASGNTAAVMAVGVNVAGLAAGSYQSTITVASGSQQRSVAVALTVQPPSPAQFALTPPAVVVNAIAGSTTPITSSIQVANAGTGAIAWTASASPSSASWLSLVSSPSGATPATVVVQIDPSGLAAGQYLGNIRFTAQGTAVSTVPVVFNVSTLPTLISSVPLLEFRGPAGSSFAPQTLPVTTSTGSSVSIKATATVASGMNWLSLSGGSAGTPASIAVSADSSGLAPGYYVGYISVESMGAQNTLLIPVVLDLGSATGVGTLSATPGGVLLTGASNSSQSGPLTQTIALSSDAASLSWNAEVPLSSEATWLSVSPASGNGNGQLTLTASPAGLPPGNYSTQVAIRGSGTSNAGLMIPVTLIVSSGAGVLVPQNTLQPVQPAGNFAAKVGIPVALRASIAGPTGAPITGANVQIEFSTGDAPQILTDVGDGTYTGVWTPLQAGPVSLVFTNLHASSGVVTGTVSAATGSQPVLPANSFVNAASFVPGLPLAVGSIYTLFGQNLASQTATAANLPLPLALGGARVAINGIAAPLFYASPSQINFLVPNELSGQSAAILAVSTDAGVVELAGVPITPQSPGIFTVDSVGDAAAIHLDGSVVSSATPASGAEVLEIFATGLGPVSNDPAGGAAPQPGAVAVDQISPVVTIAGVDAQVLFAGLAPGFTGLYQVNVVVPTGLPAGPARLTIAVGPLFSNSSVLQLR
jgi:uncharacterized protein (TIGR03437 family)